MSQDDDVERVARAIYEARPTVWAETREPTTMPSPAYETVTRPIPWLELVDGAESDAHYSGAVRETRDLARAALSAMPPRVSPELIDQLNKLATYLTEQGEYEACDLIDTVVARVTAMPQRELLREALEALEPFAKHAEVQFANHLPPHVASDDATPVWGNSWDDDGDVTVGDLRRARAAADKIRASLTQETQT